MSVFELPVDNSLMFEPLVKCPDDLIWSVDAQDFALIAFNDGIQSFFSSHGIVLQNGMLPQDMFAINNRHKEWHELYSYVLVNGDYTVDYQSQHQETVHSFYFHLFRKHEEILGISIIRKKTADAQLNANQESSSLNTENQDTLTQLLELTREWQSTLDSVHEGILLFDKSNHLIKANKNAETFFEFNCSQKNGLHMCHIFNGSIGHFACGKLTLANKQHTVETFRTLVKKRWLEIGITPIYTAENGYLGSVFVVSDITHDIQSETMLQQQTQELEVTQSAIINSMAILSEFRDNDTGAHVQRTKHFVKILLNNMNVSKFYVPRDIDLICRSAPLHDIGKVAIGDDILLKPRHLTRQEFEVMKKHTLYGRDVIEKTEATLGKTTFLKFAKEIAEYHHEKWDGTGYPHGKIGTDIPLSARVMAVADVYDALVSKRPYKGPKSMAEAFEIVVKGSGTHFDPDVIEVFKRCRTQFEDICSRFSE